MGAVAEALLQLPEVPLRCAEAAGEAGAPAALWLTAGLLAADGFALQLRLRRADKVGASHALRAISTRTTATALPPPPPPPPPARALLVG
jgi:hypothetical protein